MRFALSVLLFAAAAHAADRPIVILISLDGFPAYALADTRAPIPTLRKLAAEGTAAEGMQTVNPSVTWPNHTTLVTGVDASRHGVIFNGKILPGPPLTIDENPLKEGLVQVPTVYDIAHQAGLVTAAVAWPATRGASTIDWSFPETPDPEGRLEKEMIGQGLVSRSDLKPFDGDQSRRDEIETTVAEYILSCHTPDLLLLHLTASDSIQHEYGPHTSAANLAYAFEDDRVAQIISALQRLHLEARSTVLVVSDHGFRKVQHLIRLNSFLAREGLAAPGAVTISHGGIAMLYLADATKLLALQSRLSAIEGVKQTFTKDAYPGLQIPATNSQTPNLIIEANPGYAFDDDDPKNSSAIVVATSTGEHGYLSTDPDMDAIFIAWGAGIKKGVRLGRISNLEVAPLIAQLLKIPLNADPGSKKRTLYSLGERHLERGNK